MVVLMSDDLKEYIVALEANCRQLSARRTKHHNPVILDNKGGEALKPQYEQERKPKEEDEDEETTESEGDHRGPGRGILRRSSLRLQSDIAKGLLDTDKFQCYFENLWRNLPDEKRNSFSYLDCLWFTFYIKTHLKGNVLEWIKKEQVFSKQYVIVPILRWHHWSLLILCHMGRSMESKTSTPCMLLLDSLQNTNPKRLESEIRKFVLDLYTIEERPETKEQIYQIPLMVPKVPQQRNDEECGNFVLYYIRLFVEGAPESFSISDGYPYFMRNDWFAYDSLAGFNKMLIPS